MNELKKEMQEYILQEVSVWNKDGNREKFLPQQEYINVCDAISIVGQYIKQTRIATIKDCIEVVNELQLFDEHESARNYIISAIDELKTENKLRV